MPLFSLGLPACLPVWASSPGNPAISFAAPSFEFPFQTERDERGWRCFTRETGYLHLAREQIFWPGWVEGDSTRLDSIDGRRVAVGRVTNATGRPRRARVLRGNIWSSLITRAFAPVGRVGNPPGGGGRAGLGRCACPVRPSRIFPAPAASFPSTDG